MNIQMTTARLGLKLKKHSPELLFGAGVVGVVATVVVSARATLKAQKVYEEHKASIEIANERLETGRYDKEAHKHSIIRTWTATSITYGKLYGPAFILGVSSIACLTKSHQILQSRNTALMAAYASVEGAFKKYRERVVKELGIEKDTEFAHGVEEETYTGYDEHGNGVTKAIRNASKDVKGVGRWFDESNRHWDKDHGYNHTFLSNQQKYCDILLKKQGHLFLNEVYDMLGMERSPEGQILGWVYDSGSGYVDFGFNRYPEFIAGFQRSVFLDFNVDGVVLDVLDKK